MHCNICGDPLLTQQKQIAVPSTVDEREIDTVDCCNGCFERLGCSERTTSDAADKQWWDNYLDGKRARRNLARKIETKGLEIVNDAEINYTSDNCKTQTYDQDKRPRVKKKDGTYGLAGYKRPAFNRQKQKTAFNDARSMGGMSDTKYYEYKVEKQAEQLAEKLHALFNNR